MDSYREHLIAESLKERTIKSYTSYIGRCEAWCEAQGVVLNELTPSQVRALAATFPRSYSTQGVLRGALKRYWEMTEREKAPVGAVRLPKQPSYRNRAVDPQEAMALAKAAQYWYPQGVAVGFGLYMGLRAEEIATAEWSRLDQGWYQILGKGDKTVSLPVHHVLAEDLRYARKQAPGAAIFPGSRKRRHVTPQTIWNWTHLVAEAAGIRRITTHQLRHTAITEVRDRTKDLRVAQEFARHSNPRTTQIYTRVTGRQLTKAVESIDYFSPMEDE